MSQQPCTKPVYPTLSWTRFSVSYNPYENGYTQQELDMRRKAEILKYSNASSSGKTNNDTKAQSYARASRSRQCVQTVQGPSCSLSTNSGIPGPAFLMCYDPSIPLYNYTKKYTMDTGQTEVP